MESEQPKRDVLDVRIVSMPPQSSSATEMRNQIALLAIGSVMGVFAVVLQTSLVRRAERRMKLKEALEVMKAEEEAKQYRKE